MLLNAGAGEDSWESLGLQGDQNSPSERKSVLNIHWKDWCWCWSSNTLATWCEELTHWKRPQCWERLKAGREGDVRGQEGWMAWLTQWTWAWASSRRWCAGVYGVTKGQTQLSDWTSATVCGLIRQLHCVQFAQWLLKENVSLTGHKLCSDDLWTARPTSVWCLANIQGTIEKCTKGDALPRVRVKTEILPSVQHFLRVISEVHWRLNIVTGTEGCMRKLNLHVENRFKKNSKERSKFLRWLPEVYAFEFI